MRTSANKIKHFTKITVNKTYFFDLLTKYFYRHGTKKKWIKVIEIIIMTLHRGYTEAYISHNPVNYHGML